MYNEFQITQFSDLYGNTKVFVSGCFLIKFHTGINQWENIRHQLFKIDQLRNVFRIHTYNSADISLAILQFVVTTRRILRFFHFNKLPYYIEIILA